MLNYRLELCANCYSPGSMHVYSSKSHELNYGYLIQLSHRLFSMKLKLADRVSEREITKIWRDL